MKNRLASIKWVPLTWACLVTFLAVTLAWAGVQPTPFRTGLFGVTAGQTVRVSVLNAGEERGIIGPCFKIWDMAGNLLFEMDGESLPMGRGAFMDFTPAPADGVPPPTGVPVPDDGVPARTGIRMQLRAEVELTPAREDRGGGRIRPTDVIVTLEVFDTATGKTAFTMPFAARAGVEPTPFIPGNGQPR